MRTVGIIWDLGCKKVTFISVMDVAHLHQIFIVHVYLHFEKFV